jgi:site-specific DNA-methyltransferase (adenine-specific)
VLDGLFVGKAPALTMAASARVGLSSLDALRFLRRVRDGSASIVFLDPPFNLGKEYGAARTPEDLPPAKYEAYINHVLEESVRILEPGGSLFLYHLPYWATKFAPQLNNLLSFRHWIAIDMKNGFARGRRLYPAHYALLYYTKGDPAYFVRPRMPPTKCRHCQGEIKDYGGYAGIVREKGLNLTDVWVDLSPVRHDSLKHRDANELPVGMTDRVMHIAGRPNGVLVDPFVGSGTSLVSAVSHGLSALGNDRDRKSITVCRRRLSSTPAGQDADPS